MDPLDLELQKAFAAAQPLPQAQVEALNRQVVDTFARKHRGIARLTAFYHVALALAMFAMIALFFALSDLKQCILLAVGILMAVAGLVVIKLWFWTMHTKFATLREIKLLQLAVADLRAAQPPSPQAAADFIAAPLAPPMPQASRKSWWLALAPLWLLALAGAIYFGWFQSPPEPRDIVPYVEKIITPAEATPGTQWQQTFEVARQTQHFYPQLTAADKNARLWISVGPEGKAPYYTGTLQPTDQITFGYPNPGKYTLTARVEQPGDNMTLRIAGIDQPIGSMSFLPTFLLMLSATLALAIPLAWLQSRMLRRIDPEMT